MNEFLTRLSQQAPTKGGQEGLPYWTLWFLLSIILLLIFFIFLRDKDLRQRINMFFFGTKQKLIKIRLQHRLKKECLKKEDLIQEMGKTSWTKKIDLAGVAPHFQALEDLEKSSSEKEQKIQEINLKISQVHDAQETDSRKIENRMTQRLDLKNKI